MNEDFSSKMKSIRQAYTAKTAGEASLSEDFVKGWHDLKEDVIKPAMERVEGETGGLPVVVRKDGDDFVVQAKDMAGASDAQMRELRFSADFVAKRVVITGPGNERRLAIKDVKIETVIEEAFLFIRSTLKV